METKEIIKTLENEMNKTSYGEWVEIYEKKVFFQDIVNLLKQKEGEPEGKIYKTEPKGADEFIVTEYSIPQGKDKEGHAIPWKHKKLKIGDKYDIAINEPGAEVYIIARFVGWRKFAIALDDGTIRPENISYLALFEAVKYIEVDTDYSLSITRAEEEGGEKNV